MEPLSSLAVYTSESLMVPQLLARDAAKVVQELSQTLGQAGRVPDSAAFCEAVLKREVLVSTGMDGGLAFPHARLNKLKELSFALGRSVEPVPWGTNGTLPVRLVFLLAVPADTTNYLPLISGLARLGRDRPHLEKLHAAKTSVEMFALLGEIRIRSGRDAGSVPPSMPK